jgi:hypothetical protein
VVHCSLSATGSYPISSPSPSLCVIFSHANFAPQSARRREHIIHPPRCPAGHSSTFHMERCTCACAAETQLQQQLRALGHRRFVQHVGRHANLQPAVLRCSGRRLFSSPSIIEPHTTFGHSGPTYGWLSCAVSALSLLQRYSRLPIA